MTKDLPALGPKAGADGGAVEISVDLAAAAAERVEGGDLQSLWRVPHLLLRHGPAWCSAPLAVAATMVLYCLSPFGLYGLARGWVAPVLIFLAVFPGLIWGTLLVGVETCREDLAGDPAARLGSRWRALLDTAPLLLAQLTWVVPALPLAALGVVPELMAPLGMVALFYGGFSSFFILAARRLEERERPAAYLVGHRRALRALLLWPVDLSAHALVVGERRGEGLLDPSEGTLATHALATVVVMILGAFLGLVASPGHQGFWWADTVRATDAIFGGLATLGFVAAAQIGAGLTAYEYAALLAAERGLLPRGGWGALRVRARGEAREPVAALPGSGHTPRE